MTDTWKCQFPSYTKLEAFKDRVAGAVDAPPCPLGLTPSLHTTLFLQPILALHCLQTLTSDLFIAAQAESMYPVKISQPNMSESRNLNTLVSLSIDVITERNRLGIAAFAPSIPQWN